MRYRNSVERIERESGIRELLTVLLSQRFGNSRNGPPSSSPQRGPRPSSAEAAGSSTPARSKSS